MSDGGPDKAPERKKPLLQWMDDGDADLVPVMMGDGRSTAASYFRVPVRKEGTSESFTYVPESPVTPEMVVQCSRETGIHFHRKLGYPTQLAAIEFMDDVNMTVREETDASGGVRRQTTIRTPVGEMSETFVTPLGQPACWQEHFVRSEADLPAFSHFIENASRVIIEDDRFRDKITAEFRAEATRWPPHVPLYVVMGVAASELMSNLYMGPASAVFLLADHTALMERLFEAKARTNTLLIECAADAGADFVLGAINGLELYSPTTYRNYFIPQARNQHATAHAHGLRAWVHTCGLMNRLVEMDIYEDMQVDVLESLSHPPLGDVGCLRETRAKIGHNITTRGAVNVNLFYDSDTDQLRSRANRVMKDVRGYRHMIGDTNDSYPPYPRENILALVDEVRKSGRMLPA